jgi:hypothetical protein
MFYSNYSMTIVKIVLNGLNASSQKIVFASFPWSIHYPLEKILVVRIT